MLAEHSYESKLKEYQAKKSTFHTLICNSAYWFIKIIMLCAVVYFAMADDS
jgi:hypothetical protein